MMVRGGEDAAAAAAAAAEINPRKMIESEMERVREIERANTTAGQK